MRWDLIVKDGKLTFSQPGFSSALVPVAKDAFRFVAQGLTFQFTRENDKIVAFKLPGRGGDTVFKRKDLSIK